MVEFNSDYEILQQAIAMEVEAYEFYLALANRVEDQQIRKAFEDLAEEELEHKAKLELEVMKTGKTVTPHQEPARPEEYYILSDRRTPLDMDYKDMLMLGMEKEESSFRSYVNWVANAHSQEHREVLLALAEEEVKHKLRFETEYEMLLKKS
jgi:rubrerythrin